nr:hypothetical protein [Tanacetum cinerariifolium]
HLIHKRKWEMIFPCSFVEFPIINTNSLARYEASRNEFVLIVFYDGHATFLWHTMNETHPRAIRYGINQSGVKELLYFLFDDVVDFQINPSLISVSFHAIAFFWVLRTLRRSVFSLELRSFAMMTDHSLLLPKNAYSR